ncbi:Metallo-hydrolase/oxidoreductase [Mycena maculata]|uniref:Metallo-hydrolase/oxidoreductase n=1 Tax=Mycena maculata TaxID=230809 RepID=A0AAD7IC26_9AGAR|nr:Metallo-hydrolase/oxidoreductase [Mycena maculata]
MPTFWILAGVLTACSFFKSKQESAKHDINPAPRAAFRAARLTPTTFVLSEYNDVYREHPQIYVKIIPAARTILIIDTGCGGATVDPDIEMTSLRRYIEEVKLDCNGGAALNEVKNTEYVVVLSHCHYDHILGVEQFRDSPILVSSHSPSFVSKSNLPTHSLCESLGIETPTYIPTLVPHQHTIHSRTRVSLGVSILHTPGHTPDELAVYDAAEKMLYVGDSLYEEEAIIFPKEGSIVEWKTSIEYLIAFVKGENQTGQVRINSGHRTVCQPALEVLDAAKEFMEDVVSGRVPVRERVTVRGEENVVYQQKGGRFALRCPERLVLAARKMSEV